jgi:hypothetical protein
MREVIDIQEIWKSLNGIVKCGENYEVSNLGNVRNITTDRIKKCFVKSNGYHATTLYLDKEQKKYHIHRLVAQAFIPNPENKREVNHINGNKSDNTVVNLEWATRKENVQHCYSSGLKNQTGENNHSAKLTEEDVRKIREYHSKGILQKDLAEMYEVSKQGICNIVNRKVWKHVI